MSHWKSFKSQVLEDTNKDLLGVALREMGVELDRSIKSITNPWGKETVDAGLLKDGRPIALGFNFKQTDGKETLELTGDFYSTGLDERTFIDRLSQLYQKHSIVNKLENSGWAVEEITVKDNNEIVIDAYQYA